MKEDETSVQNNYVPKLWTITFGKDNSEDSTVSTLRCPDQLQKNKNTCIDEDFSGSIEVNPGVETKEKTHIDLRLLTTTIAAGFSDVFMRFLSARLWTTSRSFCRGYSFLCCGKRINVWNNISRCFQYRQSHSLDNLLSSRLRGGIVTFDFEMIHIWGDLRIYLVMLISIDLLGLAKSGLAAMDFLSKETTLDELPTVT